ncbi:S9 family peptidase [Nocardioides sp.]|uniref:alpha/beta hydrolase family protein n=1 Tax=Nocardioides sp. TaxID=35761 RepID=UPI0027231521|nr:hypothetical protein [Nocardioides sp.]MDO9457312.1 hypothetical protein [Nocardioides sp.]
MRAKLLARASLLVRLLVVALIALLLVGATSGASGEKAGGVIRGELDGQQVRVTLPTGDAKPRGLAIYFHGQGGSVDDRIDGPWLGGLLRSGWAVASSTFHDESWGNEASTEDVKLLTEWAEDKAGVRTSLWVTGSMGGAVSLNAMLHGAEPPPCWYGVKPAIALTEMDRVAGARRFIAEAYGGPVPEDRNPVRHIDDLPDDTRYRVVASPDDELVELRDNAGALISQLTGRGLDITYHLVTGPHEDPSHFDPIDLVAFGDFCLGDGPSPPSDTPPEQSAG